MLIHHDSKRLRHLKGKLQNKNVIEIVQWVRCLTSICSNICCSLNFLRIISKHRAKGKILSITRSSLPKMKYKENDQIYQMKEVHSYRIICTTVDFQNVFH